MLGPYRTAPPALETTRQATVPHEEKREPLTRASMVHAFLRAGLSPASSSLRPAARCGMARACRSLHQATWLGRPTRNLIAPSIRKAPAHWRGAATMSAL